MKIRMMISNENAPPLLVGYAAANQCSRLHKQKTSITIIG